VTLILLILVPLIFALLIAAAPKQQSYGLALIGTLIFAGLTLVAGGSFDWASPASADYQLATSIQWLPALGLNFSVGVDAVAMLLILLTGLLAPICVIASKTAITDNLKTYYAWLLVLQAAMVGVFAARDLVLFYICFEFTLVPMYILINLFGSTNRRAAATKFFLFTFTGSIIALAGLVYVALVASQMNGGEWSFDLGVLQSAAIRMSDGEQAWVMLALLAGFAVKVPLFPVHTWLPLAHTEAPTAGSVVLAGVLLKLGTYAIFRFVLGFCPVATVQYAPIVATLSIIGIIYGGLICWVQTDVKKLVAYSSVSHLGFCILGMFALTGLGLTGSVLYMINHGLSTGALFLLIGMMYERYHTRNMRELGGLAAKMPVWATFMVFFSMASVGLPGLNGFVSEFFCLMGTFISGREHFLADTVPSASGAGATWGPLGPWYAAVAGTGLVIGAIYLLYMLGKVVFGPLVEPHGHRSHGHGHGSHGHDAQHKTQGDTHHETLPHDLNAREIGVLVPLAALCLILGMYPTPVLRTLEGPVAKTIGHVRGAWEMRGAGEMQGAGEMREREGLKDGEVINLSANRPTLAPTPASSLTPASSVQPAGSPAHGAEAHP
jgi:NADH-quinone oxidoreductase subunit M